MKAPLLFLAVLSTVASACAQNDVTTTDVTVTQIWPKAPKGDIKILVRQAMDSARKQGNTDLSMEVGERSAEALPFMEPYSHSNNYEMRYAVMNIAAGSHSRMALHILSNVLVRPLNVEAPSVAGHILGAVTNYNRTELREWGGPALRDKLVQLASRKCVPSDWSNDYLKAISLLAAFPDSHTKSKLEMLRTLPFPSAPNSQEFLLEPTRPFVANLVLAELGDRVAMRRLQAQIARRGTNERVWLCDQLPYIGQKRIYQLLPPLLKDTRPVRANIMYVTMSSGECIRHVSPPTRVCDLVTYVMDAQLKRRRWFDIDSAYRTTSQHMETTRSRFVDWLARTV